MTQVNITCDNCRKKIMDTTLSTDSRHDSLSPQLTHHLATEIPNNKEPLGIKNILVEYKPPRSRSLKSNYANFCCAECFINWYSNIQFGY